MGRWWSKRAREVNPLALAQNRRSRFSPAQASAQRTGRLANGSRAATMRPSGSAARNFLGCILLQHIERFTYVDLSGMRLGEGIAILAAYWGNWAAAATAQGIAERRQIFASKRTRHGFHPRHKQF